MELSGISANNNQNRNEKSGTGPDSGLRTHTIPFLITLFTEFQSIMILLRFWATIDGTAVDPANETHRDDRMKIANYDSMCA